MGRREGGEGGEVGRVSGKCIEGGKQGGREGGGREGGGREEFM